MAHLDVYVDRVPGFDWEGTPTWNTRVTPLRNKRSRRNARWTEPEWRFVVPYGLEYPEHYLRMLDLQTIARGRKNALRIKNWLFNRATDWKFGVGDGVTREFQLGRLVELGGESVLLPVHALSIYSGALAPSVAAAGSPATAAFQNRTGRVLFDSAPANGAALTWSGDFDFWVFWETDDLPATIITRSGGEEVTVYNPSFVQAEPPDEDFES